jgi:hypothetical protein
MEDVVMRSACLLSFFVFALGTDSAAQPFVNVQVNVEVNQPEETSIGINPRNPDNVVAVAQVPCHYYSSFDAGMNWAEGNIEDPYSLGDPAIAFDRLGNAYYCYIGVWSHSGIYINRSTDGGVTWWEYGTPVVEHDGSVPFEDKSYPSCDWTNSPHSGNVYVAWTRFSMYGSSDPADSTWIYFSRSTDLAETFSEPLRISDQGGNAIDSDDTVEGAVPGVGPDGTVYVSWSGPRGIEFDRSTDGGGTFGPDRVISDQPGGWDFDIPGILRANGFPVTKADISYGPYRGRVYVNWSDRRHGDTDIFLIYSDDGGETWGPRIRVNDDPIGNGADQFFNWFDVDPVTGFVYIVFYDRRAFPPESTETDVFLAISEDGGATFQNVRISESPFVPNPGVFFGDYNGISAFAGRVRPLWTRGDDTVLTIWTALIDLPTSSVLDPIATQPRLLALPNPSQEWTRIQVSDASELPDLVTIYDVEGRLIRTLDLRERSGGGHSFIWDVRNGSGHLVGPGVYLARSTDHSPARIIVLP